MPDARSDIFARIREALKVKAPRPHLKGEPVAGMTSTVAKPWLPDGGETTEASLTILAEQLARLKAVLIRVPDQSSAVKAIAELSVAKQWKKVAYHGHASTRPVAAGLGCETWEVDAGFDKQKLESCDAGLTTCEAIVAQLGAILVSSTGSGGRALSILPHAHVVLAEVTQVVPDLGSALALARARHGDRMPSMLSFITGPSRTGDIERILVLGAHGPKELYLVLVG
ncbi:MAG: LutC/YkgG family protein [Opitutales bacterium]